MRATRAPIMVARRCLGGIPAAARRYLCGSRAVSQRWLRGGAIPVDFGRAGPVTLLTIHHFSSGGKEKNLRGSMDLGPQCAKNRSASSAAMQPMPAAVMACR